MNSVIASRGSGVAIQGPCAWITSPRRRAHRIAAEYVRGREAFGGALGGHEGVGFMADTEMDIRAARLAPHSAPGVAHPKE